MLDTRSPIHPKSFQGCVYVLQTVNRSLPGLLQNIINAVPFVKELVSTLEKEYLIPRKIEKIEFLFQRLGQIIRLVYVRSCWNIL